MMRTARVSSPGGRALATALALALGSACLVLASRSFAQQAFAQQPYAPVKAVPVAATGEQGPRWNELQPAQQRALKPLEREWSTIDVRSKRKWQELAVRFPTLKPEEQARVQERMTAWAKLSTRERTEARMHFQEAKQVPAQDRKARWDAYQALSPEQRQQLAERAAPPAEAARRAAPAAARADRTPRDGAPQAKSNIVPNPALVASPKAVAPTVVQARPGATTTLITRRPTPPGHQQTGLPKIAATPEFVDRATLLPQRGPQGAATRSAVAPAPEPAPRR
ncbi:MAG: DUF3106 domain-containing protein [Pseudomonadota bacterium]